MKKNGIIRFLLLGFISIAPALGSCGGNSADAPDDNIGNNVTVSVSSELLTTGPEASVVEFSVTANADWGIRTDADWVSIRPSGGPKDTPVVVTATVGANTGLDSRNAIINIVSGGKTVKTVTLTQGYVMTAVLSEKSITFGGQPSETRVAVSANTDWEISTSEEWITLSPDKGGKGDTEITVKVSANETASTRTGAVTLRYGDSSIEMSVTQLSDEVVTPEGYTLVWSDEFNEGTVPGPDWVLENWPPKHVNNELQTYTSKEIDGKRTAEIKDGFLYINCFKGNDGKIYSARMNAKPATGWLYGYFEARINLPKGKGTWPAFWMMPSNVDWNKNPWPHCGEIDIMEEVGADPNQVSSSLHTGNFNHTQGNQPTHSMYCPDAEGEFHIYALEWTEDAITTYVDGKVQLKATRASMGDDHESWPFHYAFYPILNLAWGGDWGGYKGVDDSALPVSMKVDYIRIFQKR